MTGGDWFAAVSCLVAVLSLVFALFKNRRADKAAQKHLTVEEMVAEDNREDTISKRRYLELERLYKRVEKLEKQVGVLQRADRSKQKTIDSQAARITQMKTMFLAFVERVEMAWQDGHTMPTLTAEERALLEDDEPDHPYEETSKVEGDTDV